jgi:hypothetical protein
MVMNKTEYKKQKIATAIEMLENEFGVEFDGTDEGGRLGFTVDGFSGQFSRRDMEVCLWESIPSEGLLQQEAVALENEMNTGLILIDTFG